MGRPGSRGKNADLPTAGAKVGQDTVPGYMGSGPGSSITRRRLFLICVLAEPSCSPGLCSTIPPGFAALPAPVLTPVCASAGAIFIPPLSDRLPPAPSPTPAAPNRQQGLPKECVGQPPRPNSCAEQRERARSVLSGRGRTHGVRLSRIRLSTVSLMRFMRTVHAY